MAQFYHQNADSEIATGYEFAQNAAIQEHIGLGRDGNRHIYVGAVCSAESVTGMMSCAAVTCSRRRAAYMTYADRQSEISRAATNLLFNSRQPMRIGAIVRASKQSTSDQDVRRMWQMIGDPTAIIR